MKRTLITARSPGPFDAATCTVWMMIFVYVETPAESVVDASRATFQSCLGLRVASPGQGPGSGPDKERRQD